MGDKYMNSSNAMREVVGRTNLSLNKASRAMGHNDNYLAVTLNRGSTPTATTLATLGQVCGYSLAFVPHEDLPESAIVIDSLDRKQHTDLES